MEPSASLKSKCVPLLLLGTEGGDFTLSFRRSHQALGGFSQGIRRE